VIVYDPWVIVDAVEIVTVDVAVPPADGVMGFDDRLAARPCGVLGLLSVTGDAKLPMDATVAVAVAEAPCMTLRLVGSMVRVNSGGGPTVTVMVVVW
jgi:hypothetical protein